MTPVAADWLICDTAGSLLAQLTGGSHAAVPIIPHKACCMSGAESGSGGRHPLAKYTIHGEYGNRILTAINVVLPIK